MAELNIVWQTLDRMGRSLLQRLPYLLLALLAFAAFFLGARLVRGLVRRLAERTPRGRNVALVFGRLSQSVLIFVGLLVSLSIVLPSFRASDLIQLLGISSVAIGFAFRDVLQNFLAGILILLTEPFRIGDQIIFSGFEGTVEEIQTRATLLKTYDGRRVVIPNANLFTNAVTINTAFPHRRMQYDVGIGVSDDIQRAKAAILEELARIDDVVKDPASQVLVVDLGDFSVKLRVFFWIKPPLRSEALDIQDRVLCGIKDRLVQEGIDLPYPTQQILFHDQTEETDGDRRRQREGWPAGQSSVPRPRPQVEAP